MTSVKPNRRQIQAAATRQEILNAAQDLFVRNGFTATTIAEIASAAGVAVQTVYKTFTSKEGILLGLLERFEQEARRLSEVADFTAGANPIEQLARVVSFHCQLFAAAQDMLDVFRGAAADQGEMAVLWEEGGRRRRRSQAPVVREWHTAGHLRAGLSERRAADLLWAMTGPDVYSLMVIQCGWRRGEFERWLNQSLREMLFGTEMRQ